MAEPNYALLAAVVLAQDTTYHTKHAAIWEQITNYVWYKYRNTDGHDIAQWNPPTDVAGLGEVIYAAFVAAGLTSLIGGAAYCLEKLGTTILTYPYLRPLALVQADKIDRMGV